MLATALDAAGSATCVSVFEEAVALLAASPARLELARAEFGLGGALRRRGQVSKRPPAPCPGRRAGNALRGNRFGGAGRRPNSASPAAGRASARSPGSTRSRPSERRAVEFAALGRTNRAIAQELYVTPKTVEVHLSSAYRKLGITSRGELAAMWPEGPAT